MCVCAYVRSNSLVLSWHLLLLIFWPRALIHRARSFLKAHKRVIKLLRHEQELWTQCRVLGISELDSAGEAAHLLNCGWRSFNCFNFAWSRCGTCFVTAVSEIGYKGQNRFKPSSIGHQSRLACTPANKLLRQMGSFSRPASFAFPPSLSPFLSPVNERTEESFQCKRTSTKADFQEGTDLLFLSLSYVFHGKKKMGGVA